MSDIVTELRSYGQEGEPLLLQDDSLLARAADEIERLRMTGEEQASLERTVSFVEDSGWGCQTLRGFLSRCATHNTGRDDG